MRNSQPPTHDQLTEKKVAFIGIFYARQSLNLLLEIRNNYGDLMLNYLLKKYNYSNWNSSHPDNILESPVAIRFLTLYFVNFYKYLTKQGIPHSPLFLQGKNLQSGYLLCFYI